MQNRSYDFVIEFGKAQNMETKFNNYKAFFKRQQPTIRLVNTKT